MVANHRQHSPMMLGTRQQEQPPASSQLYSVGRDTRIPCRVLSPGTPRSIPRPRPSLVKGRGRILDNGYSIAGSIVGVCNVLARARARLAYMLEYLYTFVRVNKEYTVANLALSIWHYLRIIPIYLPIQLHVKR